MGQDGLEGARHLSDLGAPIMVQDQESSRVWGMPGEIAKAGLAEEIAPLTDIGWRINHKVLGSRAAHGLMSTI